ncbi:hypothetical protein BKA69DRAFT_1057236 [Paraphysoderma sedebokerense]|nr:hypothetical protein BKA69DRAFT_1057236 [Paraphysoderma sedebokerense]
MSRAKMLTIAVAKGDGIGTEIMAAALKVLDAAKVPLSYKMVDMGKEVYLSGHNTGMTTDARKTVESLGILFKGPMETPKGSGMKSINVTARKVWNTYANKRIFKSLPGVDTVFSKANIPIDITLIRENIEDTYGGIEHLQTPSVAQCRRLITRPGSVQVHRYAFHTALNKSKTRRITCSHKANIMKLTDGMFLEAFRSVAKDYAPIIKEKGCTVDDIIVDDLAMKLVAMPDRFDTVILPNLQGDIISDLCAGLVGGLGMAPSANIGDRICIFEAVHGSAPDIAGKGISNPSALILSSVMMLRHLGLNSHAQAVQTALETTLQRGLRTRDLCNSVTDTPLTTDEYAHAIIKHLPKEITADTFYLGGPAVTGSERKITLPTGMTLPPDTPDKHVMLLDPTPRSESRPTEKVVGVDVFVDSELRPNDLAKNILAALPEVEKSPLDKTSSSTTSSDLSLIMLSNRGTQVYPTSSMFTECVNHYRVRIESKSGKGYKTSDLLELVKKLTDAGEKKKSEEVMRVCSVEMLLNVNGVKGYSLAQGQ